MSRSRDKTSDIDPITPWPEAWTLYGHGSAVDAFADAMERRQLHHAWLLEGPTGIGKSLLARSLSALALGARSVRESEGLSFRAEDDRVNNLLAQGSHPDARWIARGLNDRGKLRQDITIDQLRDLIQFLALKPAMGGRRVAIIDSLDELNRSGANAILKTLEEPPEATLLILISHRTRPVLPTIRSRCRTVRLKPLSEESVVRVRGEAFENTALPSAWSGRPGLANATSVTLAGKLRPVLEGILTGRRSGSSALLKDMSASPEALGLALEILLGLVQERARSQASAGSATTGIWSKLWLKLSALNAEHERLNMDALQTSAAALDLVHRHVPMPSLTKA